MKTGRLKREVKFTLSANGGIVRKRTIEAANPTIFGFEHADYAPLFLIQEGKSGSMKK